MVPPPPAECGEVEVAAISGEHGAAAPWGFRRLRILSR